MPRRRLYTFAIDADLDAGLDAVKTADGIAESEQIRRALREWLSRRPAARSALKADRRRGATRRRP